MSGEKPVRRSHAWNRHQRVTLCLLKRLDHIKRKERTALFNSIYETRLLLEGYPHGLNPGALEAQYHEMKIGGKGHDLLCEVDYTPRDNIRFKFGDHVNKIVQAAQDLNIGVTFISVTTKSAATPLVSRHRQPSASITSISELSLYDSDTTVRPQNPRRRPKDVSVKTRRLRDHNLSRFASSTPYPPILRSRLDGTGKSTPKFPTILFRCAEPSHRFRARKFQNEEEAIPSPAPFGTPEFLGMVWPHLRRSKAYESPFISFAQNARRALSLVETKKSEVATDERQLAIFSFLDMQADARARYGMDDSGPYLVPRLFSGIEVSPLPNGYKGGGEWLCFGSVECAPIAVLEAEDAISLARSLLSIRKVDADAGIELGKHLTSVPNKWKQSVAYCLLNSYRGKKVPKPGTSQYLEVMQGIYGVECGRERSRSIARSVPPSAYDEDAVNEDRYDPNEPIIISDDENDGLEVFSSTTQQEMGNIQYTDESLIDQDASEIEEDVVAISDSDSDIPYKPRVRQARGIVRTRARGNDNTHGDGHGRDRTDTDLHRTERMPLKELYNPAGGRSLQPRTTRCAYRISDLWSDSESDEE